MPAVTPSTVAQAVATAAGNGMANLPTPATTWQTLIAGGNLMLAAFVDAFRTGISFASIVVFQNGWGNFGGGTFAAGYMKDASGRVFLRGCISGGTVNLPMTTLPVGFRPAAICGFACPSNLAMAQVIVDASGNVTVQAGSATYVYLDGISFMAA